MNLNLDSGVDLATGTVNTVFKTLGGLAGMAVAGIVLAFSFGMVFGCVLPIISFVYLCLSDKQIDFLSAPVKGSYVWWRIKMFLGCWFIGICCWLTCYFLVYNQH